MIQNQATIYHLNRSEVLIFIWNARVVIQPNKTLMDHILSFFYQTPWKNLLISCQRNFSSSSHTKKTPLNIWIISQLKTWKYLVEYFLNTCIYFTAIEISSNEYRNLKTQTNKKKYVINHSSKNISKGRSLMPTGNVVFHH